MVSSNCPYLSQVCIELQICIQILSNYTGVFTKCPISYLRLGLSLLLLLFKHRLFFFAGMIAHGHGDVKYAHYGLDFYPGDANHMVGSFAKLLRDLEKPPVQSSCALFDGCGTTPLYEALLTGKEVCMSSLPEPPGAPICAKPLPPTLHVQLDNCAKDNKCRYVF